MRQHDGKAASAEEKGREGAQTCATSAAATQLASCCSIAQSFAATQAIKQAVTELELGGKPVSERGCLPTKLTDT